LKWIKVNGKYIEPENIEDIREAKRNNKPIPKPVYKRKLNLYEEFNKLWLKEVYRVMKPGAYLIAFSGTRTYHRLVSAAEDVGFRIRDMIEWEYG